MFGGLCWLHQQFILDAKACKGKGRTITAPWGAELPRPELGMAARHLKMLKDFCQLFGMTPSARSRIQLPGQEGQSDLFDDFMKEMMKVA